MAGRLKHMERSHRSYKNNKEAVFVSFDNKARVKASDRAMRNPSFLERVGSGIRKMFHREQSR